MTLETELPFDGALDAVKRIEAAISARNTARDTAEEGAAAAHAEAGRILADARRAGAEAGQERRAAILSNAGADAAAIRARGATHAEEIITKTLLNNPQLLAMLIPLVLQEEG
jgi:vacuolar-type H+-ATPase subunit H